MSSSPYITMCQLCSSFGHSLSRDAFARHVIHTAIRSIINHACFAQGHDLCKSLHTLKLQGFLLKPQILGSGMYQIAKTRSTNLSCCPSPTSKFVPFLPLCARSFPTLLVAPISPCLQYSYARIWRAPLRAPERDGEVPAGLKPGRESAVAWSKDDRGSGPCSGRQGRILCDVQEYLRLPPHRLHVLSKGVPRTYR